MELTWNSRELRDLCERRELAFEKLGEQVAIEIGMILADLEAAGSMAEFMEIAAATRELIDMGTAVEVVLDGGGRICLESGHATGARFDTWDTVTRCRIRQLGLPS